MKDLHTTVGRSIVATLAIAFLGSIALSQIPGQLAADYAAGNAPGAEEIAKVEKEVAAKPGDYQLVRKLGKGYFFRFFGPGEAAAVPKAQATLEKALVLQKDDPESLAYLGGLYIFAADRLEEKRQCEAKGRLRQRI